MTETVASVLGLAVFLFLAYQAGKLLNKFKNRQFTKAWQPLIGVIDGQVHEDPLGGGASSWLAGQWKGMTIHAKMSPAVRTTNQANHENRFSVGVAQLTGRMNWHVGSRGVPPQTDVISDDKALEDRLRAAGILDLAARAQCFSIRYDRSSQYLFVMEDVAPLWTPPPERFTVLLDLAVEVARAHSRVNPA